MDCRGMRSFTNTVCGLSLEIKDPTDTELINTRHLSLMFFSLQSIEDQQRCSSHSRSTPSSHPTTPTQPCSRSGLDRLGTLVPQEPSPFLPWHCFPFSLWQICTVIPTPTVIFSTRLVQLVLPNSFPEPGTSHLFQTRTDACFIQ